MRIRSPRLRQFLLLVGVLSVLIGPTTTPAQAQVVDDTLTDGTGWRFDSVVTGQTQPDHNPEHSLGLNRVADDSQFATTQINAVIDCRTGDGRVEVTTPVELRQPAGHAVSFWSDDDPTDGFGEISPTDTQRQFTGTGNEVRVPDLPGSTELPDTPVVSTVQVRIVNGRFHRIGTLIDVDLTLDVRVSRADEGLICETRSTDLVRHRIIFTIIPVMPDPHPVLGRTRNILVGVGFRHGRDTDQIPPFRAVCGLVSPHSTRMDVSAITVPPPLTNPNPEGRDQFHPCHPEGQG